MSDKQPTTVPMDDQLDDPIELKALLHYANTLSDPTALRVIGALAAQECSAADLHEIARLKPADMKKLLDRLRWLGLLRQRMRDERTLYQLDQNGLKRLNRAVQSVSKETFAQRPASAADLEEGEEWERKILRNFFEGERLREIPATMKAFNVVLRWLVNQFDEHVRYPEREVNEILKRYNEDFATLRRGLIDAGLMRRENNVYWRA